MDSQLTLWADVSSIAGVVISVIGFLVTWRNVTTSRKAADQARVAVMRVREDLAKYDVIAELGAAVAIMDEIKRLNRHGAWPILPDRYSALRQRLITIRASNLDLSEPHLADLNGAIQQIRNLEQTVESALSKQGQAELDKARFNSVVSKQLDKMTEVLVSIRTDVVKRD